MKSFILMVLSFVLLVRFTAALPHSKAHLRFRREIVRKAHAKFFETNVEQSEYDKIIQIGIAALLNFANATIQQEREFYNDVVKEIEKSDNNFTKELQELKDFSKNVDALAKEQGKQLFDKTWELFEQGSLIDDKYDLDKNRNPTEKQKELAKIFDDVGSFLLVIEYLQNVTVMRENFHSKFQPYADTLKPAENSKEQKFLEWFKKFKNEEDFKRNTGVMFEFFQFLQ